MKKRILIVTLFVYLAMATYSQDSVVIKLDTSFFSTSFISGFLNIQPDYNYIYHIPDSADEKFYKKNKSLVNQPITEKNHNHYYHMACVLWNLENIREAEKMFLTIYQSNLKTVNSTYYSNSDIPGDTTINTYGYGSFSSHYKNDVCIYLSKIYIEQKKFNQGLFYLNKAVNKYKASYNCGTGFNLQKNEYNSLYALCYEGIGQYQKVIDLLLPVCLDWDCTSLITSIRKVYSRKTIANYLLLAERSIICKVDTFESESYMYTNWHEKNEKIDTIRYYSGSGNITLFNKKINLPYPNLENGQRLTRKYYVDLFRKSSFYRKLSNKED